MKNIILLFTLSIYCSLTYAQVTKDLLIKVHSLNTTDIQSLGLAAADEGVIVYNTTEKKIYQFDGTNLILIDNQDLADVLVKGNDANGLTISNLGTPTQNTDAATKLYADNAIAFQHVSINEYLATEPTISKNGEILYVVPSELNGKKITEMICSVFKAGTGTGSTNVNLIVRRNGINTTVFTNDASIAVNNFSVTVTFAAGFEVNQGDILFLDITSETSNLAEGLTATITFTN